MVTKWPPMVTSRGDIYCYSLKQLMLFTVLKKKKKDMFKMIRLTVCYLVMTLPAVIARLAAYVTNPEYKTCIEHKGWIFNKIENL